MSLRCVERSMFKKIIGSPALIRVLPFALFLVLTFAQDKFGDEGRFWIYIFKTVVGVILVGLMWPYVREMRWHLSWEAVVVGIGVFVLWVGLDPLLVRLGFENSYPRINSDALPWNPNVPFGSGSMLALFFVVGRILGSSIVVPPLEEVFYRSFVYRYLASKDFMAVPFRKFAWVPFLVTAGVFGTAHREWIAAILCAFAYQGLVIWKDRLGDAITAHSITNFLLGLWVVWRNEWHFW